MTITTARTDGQTDRADRADSDDRDRSESRATALTGPGVSDDVNKVNIKSRDERKAQHSEVKGHLGKARR